ncbi:MAG: hypothetical protein FWH11_11380 [Micrococcales bacterium]|nr:hypothetical protein [Micrococcales bacterium]
MSQYAATDGSTLAVRLVAHHQIPVPTHSEYLKDWVAHARAVLTGDGIYPKVPLCTETVVADRFVEHVRSSVAAVLPAPALSRVVVAGVARGWLDRAEAVDLVLAALDGARRPGDRKAWLGAWLDDLGVTDAEIVTHADALVPVLAHGDGSTVERLAPVLIAGVSDDQLSEVATVALAVSTKKALAVVLGALAARPRTSDETAEVLGSQVAALDVGRDRSLARAVQGVGDAWGLVAQTPTEPAVTVQGLWRPVPPVWTVPRFDHGEETPEALTEAAAELVARGGTRVTDVVTERFLALANAVARRDPEAARTALRGVPSDWLVGHWVAGDVDQALTDQMPYLGRGTREHEVPVEARERDVVARLGQVPCLLSEPSTVDLAVDLADLVARLRVYQQVGASVSEADLFLALTRLSHVDQVDAGVLAELDRLTVPVLVREWERTWPPEGQHVAQDQEVWRLHVRTMAITAGPAVRQYLADPVVEPGVLTDDPSYGVVVAPVVVPASLAGLPPRLISRFWTKPGEPPPTVRYPAKARAPICSEFPGWTGDAAWLVVRVHDGYVPHLPSVFPNAAIGLVLRQMVRRATPLPPGGAVNLLAIQRSLPPGAEAEAAAAVREAWERGLLRPGVPDVRWLDWAVRPAALAATARALAGLAADGMLAVVWPVLDDLLVAATDAPRLLAGAAEVAQTVAALLPEVLHAVSTGLAGSDALALPGTRALAARSGSSQAVRAAQEVIAQLPSTESSTDGETMSPDTRPATLRDAAAWQAAAALPAVDDRGTLTASTNPNNPKVVRFDLDLPDHPDRLYLHWGFELRHGRCGGAAYPRGTTVDFGIGFYPPLNVYVHWDTAASRLVVEPYDRQDTPPATPYPLSVSVVAVALGATADTYQSDDKARELMNLVGNGQVGSPAVAAAARVLARQEAVDQTRLVRLVDKHPAALPTLWPILTELISAGAAADTPPRWLNRALDTALHHADQLGAATRHGIIGGWPGLADLAARPGKSAVLTKARALLAVVEEQ